MNDLKLVIFDMDGLIFDTEKLSFLAWDRCAKKEGFDFSLETYKKLIGISDEESKHILRDLYGDRFSEDALVESYKKEFNRIVNEEEIVVKAGFEKLARVLNDRGIKKCIASSNEREVIEHFLSLTGLKEEFDFYVSGTEVENGKPSPDIFLEACKRGNERPESSLVLEDSYHGLIAATRAGIQCMIVPDLIEPNEEMRNKAYRICSDLGEVAEVIGR